VFKDDLVGDPGGTYRQVSYVAGVGRARLVGTVRGERAEHAEKLMPKR